ncbi:hypothetical protein GII36_05405 [Candidatus Mycosynbacter amalyticus]|uniref:Lipoprotein n=1 Tax=Candidatus Mycosynbacter amalyticus TaxID=2665156 RepID=A0A857MKV8_9BACT|nr:hypothetical protein [Candidatus Mycosynbacter amalyticus]QHN43254.1 hypothetical protein GII36_05405 [Candidatus Mycosynbacter amalyticus]
MKRRVETFGGALALTAAIVSGCSKGAAVHEITRPSAAEIYSELPKGARCAIELGKYVIGKFQLPQDANNGNFHAPGVLADNAELTLTTHEGGDGRRDQSNMPVSIATFTYGAYLHHGEIVDSKALADVKVAGALSFQLNPGETATGAMQQAALGSIGVDESNQFVQTPTSSMLDAQTETAADYCKIAEKITSK